MKKYLLARLANQLFPSNCPSCSAETDTIPAAPFCLGCWSSIRRYSGPSCRVCSEPLTSEYADTCSSCMKDPPPFSKAMSFGIYEGVLASAIHVYKFQSIRRLYKPLGRFLLLFDIKGVDALVPVPLSVKRLRDRGFNQSLLLAKVISENTGIKLVMDGLFKKADTRPQLGLPARQRILNVRGAFGTSRDFSGMRVLLIDDVMTTGATVRECSKELMKAGAKEIEVLTLARAGLK